MPGRIITRHDVVVVGAGWTGLISAKTYLDFAPDADLVILDSQKSIGGVWCAERLYPDLYAQVSHPLFEYSFYDMPKEGITRDGFLSGYTINRYLNDFARDFGLASRVRLETAVTRVERAPAGGWILSSGAGPPVECARLIWAVGPGSSPVLPAWPRDGFAAPVVHSADTGASLARIAGVRRATVVGAAKSAFDAVYLLLRSGKEVDWVVRGDGAGPMAIGPPSLLGIWNTVDGLSTRAMAMFSPSIMGTSGFWYWAIHRTRLGRLAARGYWRCANLLADCAAGYSASEDLECLRPAPRGYGMFWARAGLGAPSAPDFWKTLHSDGLHVIRGEVESLSHTDTVNLKSGISLQTDMVIACTGFEKPYRPFSRALREELGLEYAASESPRWAKLHADAEAKIDALLPLLRRGPEAETVAARADDVLRGPNRHYRRLVPLAGGDRSICFPGLVHVIMTPTVSEFQALWCAAYLLGKLPLPGLDEMEDEVATFNVWTRKRHLEMGQKHAYCIFDYLSVILPLLVPAVVLMCCAVHRHARQGPRHRAVPGKGNPFSELFVRYKPRDYRGMVDEFLAAQKQCPG